MNEPEPVRGGDFFLRAFWDLSTCRSGGFGLGPIPWDKILLYAHHHDLDDDLRETFIFIVRELDRVYIDWQEKNPQQKITAVQKGRRKGKTFGK